MTTHVIYCTDDDTYGWLINSDSSWTNAKNGLGSFSSGVGPAENSIYAVAAKNGTPYEAGQSFCQFDLTGIASSRIITSAKLELFSVFDGATGGGSNGVVCQVRKYNGGSITTADWRNISAYSALPLMAHAAFSSFPELAYIELTNDAMIANLVLGAVNGIVIGTDFMISGTPTDYNWVQIATMTDSGWNYPRLTLETVPGFTGFTRTPRQTYLRR